MHLHVNGISFLMHIQAPPSTDIVNTQLIFIIGKPVIVQYAVILKNHLFLQSNF